MPFTIGEYGRLVPSNHEISQDNELKKIMARKALEIQKITESKGLGHIYPTIRRLLAGEKGVLSEEHRFFR